MSRTYREFPVLFCNNCDKPSVRKNAHIKGHPEICDCDWDVSSGWYHKMVKSSDHKQWFKPPKWFKRQRQQRFRAQVKQALHKHVYKGKPFTPPINKKTDQWEWT